MEDILPILDLSMEDTLPFLDLSMEDILVIMARERLMLNQRLRLRLRLMLCTPPMDMDQATLPTLGLPMQDTLPTLDLSMEDTLPILDLSMEDILATMARERLMLNQRLMLRLMLCTLPMDMDVATLLTLGLPMQDTHTLDLSMEDILVTMARERLMLNQRLMLMLSTLPM